MDEKFQELKEAVVNLIAREGNDADKFDIEMMVEKYFEEEVSLFRPEELSRFAGTPEKLIQHFKVYLEKLKSPECSVQRLEKKRTT